ncbi:MAG TPA: 4a-hydroxytetrahydrobiopterin dehydratase [Bryobacteraceae bacterium]
MRLEGEELSSRAAGLPDWQVREEHHLAKTFLFPDFQSALEFVNRVGVIAEEQGHHPDLHLAWGRVDVDTSTHDAGGLTESDFTLAAAIDRAYSSR